MHIGERRKHQLKQEGIRLEKVEEKATQIIKELKDEDYTLKESKILVEELNCVLTEIERHSSGVKLSELSWTRGINISKKL